MFCVLEKIAYQRIKVSNCSDIPKIITYEWLFNYIKEMIINGTVLEEIEFKDDILYITRRYYKKNESYVRKDKYMIDSSLQNDLQFMSKLFELINYYKTIRKIIDLKIDAKLDSIEDNKRMLLERQKIIEIINKAIVEYDKTGNFLIEVDNVKLLQEVISDTKERKIRSILFPVSDTIYANTKTCVTKRKVFYASFFVMLVSFISNLFNENISVNFLVDIVSAIFTIISGSSLVLSDIDAVDNLTNKINEFLEEKQLTKKRF